MKDESPYRDKHQPSAGGPACMQVTAFTDNTTTWHASETIGVYCEPQQGAHCGAHALAALLGRRITTQRRHLVPELSTWCTEEKYS